MTLTVGRITHRHALGRDAVPEHQGIVTLDVDQGVDAVVHGDVIGVVAGAAVKNVVPAAAVETVIAVQTTQGIGGVVAHQQVAAGVAGGIDSGVPGKHDILDVIAECVVDAAQHRIGTGISVLDHPVTGVIHDIDIVAHAAIHPVGAGPAIQPVVTRPAVEGVVTAEGVQDIAGVVPAQGVIGGVAGGIDGGIADQD